MDVANIYDSKKDVQEFDKLEVKLISVIDTVEELIRQQKELNPLFAKGTPKEYASAMSQLNDVLSRLAKTEKDLLDLTKNYDKIAQNNNNTTRQSTKDTDGLSKQTALLREKKRLLNKEAKDQAQVEIQNQQLLNASLGLYNKVQLKLNALTVKYNELAIKKQLGLKLSAAEEKSYNNLSAKIQKYDGVLKAVDATVGKHQRNVGNYASAFNPLSHSINQLTREAPAFANSLQTGFMAISNNIPALQDAIKEIIAQNKILRAEGKPTQSVLKQLATSFFSWTTAISLAATLLTIYGKDIAEWVVELINGKKALDSLTASQTAFSDALKNGDYANAVKSVKEMADYVKLAKEGFIDKERVLKEYNEGLGKVLGTANSFNQIEQILIDKTSSYLEAMRLRSAAQVALQKSSEARAKADFAAYQKDDDFFNWGEKVSQTLLKIIPLSKKGLEESNALLKKNAQQARKETVAAANEESKTWDKVYNDLEKKAAEVAKKGGLNVTNLFLGGEKQKKDNTLKDALRDLEAIRDTLLAINEKNFVKGIIDEETYVKKAYEINKAFYNSKLNLIKGKNAEERKIIAQTKLELEKAEHEKNDKLFEIEKRKFDKSKNLMEAELANKMKAIQNDPYLMETDRLKQQASVYDELIKRTDLYYASLIQSAGKNKNLILQIEKERDEKRIELMTKLQDLMAGMPDAIQKDLQYYQKIEDAYRTASDLEKRRVILANSKLTIDQREYLISVLEKNQEIEKLELQQKRLQLEAASIAAKAVSLQLSTAEAARLSEINLQLSDIGYELERQKKQKLVLEWGELRKNLSPTIDYIRNSFNDLGLENLSNSFDNVLNDIGERFKETGKITLKFKDIAILAASAVADALTQISTAQKERTIADLDEQLKRSQEVTDQEVGFINQRLEKLNAIQDKTAEQTQERNRLEDEARGMREQQAMREKLIEKQKARAEQKAAAQQALINAGLAATKTLATLGVPAGLLPAGIALAFGAVQAGLIMSKNPVPQYFVGTNHASEGWALTQERGAEIITDKSGNIKTWGNNRGAQMTYMQEGDKVLTAFESQDFKKKIRDISMPSNIFLNNARDSVLPSIIIPKQEDNSQKIIDGVGRELERVFGKFDKTNVYENENGDIVIEKGTKIPEVRRKKKPKPTTIIIQKPNVRD